MLLIAQRAILLYRLLRVRLYKRTSCHCFGLWYAHQLQNRRSDVGKAAVLRGLHLVAGIDDDELHGVEGMCGVRRAVGVDRMVGVSVVSREKNRIVLRDSGLDDTFHALVNLRNGAAD